jgi:hypothetical protein
VFVSAAAGNLASYINYQRSAGGGAAPPPAAPGSPAAAGWYYDVDKVGGSMGLFYGAHRAARKPLSSPGSCVTVRPVSSARHTTPFVPPQLPPVTP